MSLINAKLNRPDTLNVRGNSSVRLVFALVLWWMILVVEEDPRSYPVFDVRCKN